MTQASPPSADDIAYIRHLSESGAKAPLIGGRFTAWWGFLLTVAYVGQHLIVTGVLTPPNRMLAIIWFRCLAGHFNRENHFAFEAVAWYWHFVDVVWLGLFLFVYVL